MKLNNFFEKVKTNRERSFRTGDIADPVQNDAANMLIVGDD